jgi:hypothetical protein
MGKVTYKGYLIYVMPVDHRLLTFKGEIYNIKGYLTSVFGQTYDETAMKAMNLIDNGSIRNLEMFGMHK